MLSAPARPLPLNKLFLASLSFLSSHLSLIFCTTVTITKALVPRSLVSLPQNVILLFHQITHLPERNHGSSCRRNTFSFTPTHIIYAYTHSLTIACVCTVHIRSKPIRVHTRMDIHTHLHICACVRILKFTRYFNARPSTCFPEVGLL